MPDSRRSIFPNDVRLLGTKSAELVAVGTTHLKWSSLSNFICSVCSNTHWQAGRTQTTSTLLETTSHRACWSLLLFICWLTGMAYWKRIHKQLVQHNLKSLIDFDWCLFFLFCQILIEGTVGDDFNGDIAIDDLSFLECDPYDGKWICRSRTFKLFNLLFILFYLVPNRWLFKRCFDPGELPTSNTTTPAVTTAPPTVQPHSCPDGEFVCGTHGECVANGKVCDFRRDCSDGSDEDSCGQIFIFPSLRISPWKDLIIAFLLFSQCCVLCFPLRPPVLIHFSLPPVKERCDFEGGDACGWSSVDTSLVPMHSFRWSPDQGESVHDGEQYHRPINDHTLWVPPKLIMWQWYLLSLMNQFICN